MNLSALNGIFEKIGVGLTMSRRLTDPPIQIMISLAGGAAALIYGEYMIATRLGAALDRASRWLPFTPPFGETAARYLLRRSSYSIKGAREALGYEPAVDLAEGMARMARDL